MKPPDISTSKAIKPTRTLLSLFWALIAAFVATLIALASMGSDLLPGEYGGIVVPSMFGLFLVLSIPELIFAIRERMEIRLRRFLILTGASALGLFISFMLHNAFYAIFIYFFGEGFWEKVGLGDEPFFFVFAVIVCPVAFLVGAIGTIVLFIKRRKAA